MLELEIALIESVTGETKAGLWQVLSLSATTNRSRTSTHRLTLTLRLADDSLIGEKLPRRPT